MRLYLVQHGEAVPEDIDPDRPLTTKGAADVTRLATRLARTGTSVTRILHSGKLRAMQTAEALAPLLAAGGVIEERAGLSPSDSPERLLESLGDGDVIVASHMPFVARAVSAALNLPQDDPVVMFEPGSVAVLERRAGGAWRVIGFLRPEHF